MLRLFCTFSGLSATDQKTHQFLYRFIIQFFSSFSENVHIFSLLSFVNCKREQDYKITALSMYLRLSEPVDRFH